MRAASIWPNILAKEFSITWVGDSNWLWNRSIYSVAAEESTIVTRTEFELTLSYGSVWWSSNADSVSCYYSIYFSSRPKHLHLWAVVSICLHCRFWFQWDGSWSSIWRGRLVVYGVSHCAVTPRFYHCFPPHARSMNKVKECLECTFK